jgi:hypothetical protein
MVGTLEAMLGLSEGPGHRSDVISGGPDALTVASHCDEEAHRQSPRVGIQSDKWPTYRIGARPSGSHSRLRAVVGEILTPQHRLMNRQLHYRQICSPE